MSIDVGKKAPMWASCARSRTPGKELLPELARQNGNQTMDLTIKSRHWAQDRARVHCCIGLWRFNG
jgi:hypothetical protein